MEFVLSRHVTVLCAHASPWRKVGENKKLCIHSIQFLIQLLAQDSMYGGSCQLKVFLNILARAFLLINCAKCSHWWFRLLWFYSEHSRGFRPMYSLKCQKKEEGFTRFSNDFFDRNMMARALLPVYCAKDSHWCLFNILLIHIMQLWVFRPESSSTHQTKRGSQSSPYFFF